MPGLFFAFSGPVVRSISAFGGGLVKVNLSGGSLVREAASAILIGSGVILIDR
jgi:hypothetical protein